MKIFILYRTNKMLYSFFCQAEIFRNPEGTRRNNLSCLWITCNLIWRQMRFLPKESQSEEKGDELWGSIIYLYLRSGCW